MKRKRTREAEVAFANDLRNWNWSCLNGGVDNMAEELEKAIGILTNIHLPLVRTRKRSNRSQDLSENYGREN